MIVCADAKQAYFTVVNELVLYNDVLCRVSDRNEGDTLHPSVNAHIVLIPLVPHKGEIFEYSYTVYMDEDVQPLMIK